MSPELPPQTRSRGSLTSSKVVRAGIAAFFVVAAIMVVAGATPNVAAASQTAWSMPIGVGGPLYGVSCPNQIYCVAMGVYGDAFVYNGSSWSSGVVAASDDMYDISCASTTFCAAVGADGTESIWNGSTWSAGNVPGESGIFLSVSCTNTHFCVAVDQSGNSTIYNGSSWSSPAAFDGDSNDLETVACPSTTFCMAVDGDGNVFTYNGATWTGPDNIDGGNLFQDISCVSTTFCVAVDNDGNAFTYNGSSWSGDDIGGTAQLPSVSCATTSFCVAGDTEGDVYMFNGSSWSPENIDDNVIVALSCPTTSFCVATDDAGNAMTYGWVSASYSCNFPGTGSTPTSVLLSESPSPPPSIPAPGTFQTTLSAQVTIPAAAVNSAIGDGASSITIGSQSVETEGLTPSDTPSSSVNPNALTASATNLPITFSPQSNTPYTYPTTYNPETWQTVNVPGTVDFTPGPIDLSLTYLISGVPTAESVTCTPPGGVTDLDTTNVTGSGPTPSFQVPPSVPPLQSQVSVPLDGGWAIEIANTSTANVTGLSAAITVKGGGGTLTYDLAGMSNTGTTCTSSGANMATCTVGTLAGGTTKTLNVLVKTTGLAQGTTITGSANVTSTNASSQSSSLTGIDVVVVPQGVAAVAVPSLALASSKKKPSVHLPAKTTLTLPKKVPAMGPFERPDVEPLAKVKGPPVSVTLQALAGSQDPELCPPSAGGCEGDIVDIEGNFSSYTSTATPISAVIEIFYGSSVPSGHMYFQSSAGETPSLLPACVKTGGHYNTPCVDGAEHVVGQTGKRATEDTVFFTGGDPLVGRR